MADDTMLRRNSVSPRCAVFFFVYPGSLFAESADHKIIFFLCQADQVTCRSSHTSILPLRSLSKARKASRQPSISSCVRTMPSYLRLRLAVPCVRGCCTTPWNMTVSFFQERRLELPNFHVDHLKCEERSFAVGGGVGGRGGDVRGDE